MTTKRKFVAKGASLLQARNNSNLVGGGGGSRAILAVAGFIFAMHKSGIVHWNSIGGVSGGAFPTLMYANGMSAGQVVMTAINVPFEGMLTRRKNYLQLMLTLLVKERLETTRPLWSVFGTEKVADFIDELVPVWPEKYWTMAVFEDTQIFFTARGVFQCYYDGKIVQLTDKPIKVSEAIRASMAVPGFIEPRFWNGMQLVDGGMSWDGLCPIQAAMRNFKVEASGVFACHVGSQKLTGIKGWLRSKWNALLAFGCPWTKEEKDPSRWASQGAMLVLPELNKFGSMKFTLTDEEKWDSVRTAFRATLSSLLKKGLIDRYKFLELVALVNHRENFMMDCKSN